MVSFMKLRDVNYLINDVTMVIINLRQTEERLGKFEDATIILRRKKVLVKIKRIFYRRSLFLLIWNREKSEIW